MPPPTPPQKTHKGFNYMQIQCTRTMLSIFNYLSTLEGKLVVLMIITCVCFCFFVFFASDYTQKTFSNFAAERLGVMLVYSAFSSEILEDKLLCLCLIVCEYFIYMFYIMRCVVFFSIKILAFMICWFFNL